MRPRLRHTWLDGPRASHPFQWAGPRQRRWMAGVLLHPSRGAATRSGVTGSGAGSAGACDSSTTSPTKRYPTRETVLIPSRVLRHVAQRFADFADALRQRVLDHGGVGPDRVEQLLFPDHALPACAPATGCRTLSGGSVIGVVFAGQLPDGRIEHEGTKAIAGDLRHLLVPVLCLLAAASDRLPRRDAGQSPPGQRIVTISASRRHDSRTTIRKLCSDGRAHEAPANSRGEVTMTNATLLRASYACLTAGAAVALLTASVQTSPAPAQRGTRDRPSQPRRLDSE